MPRPPGRTTPRDSYRNNVAAYRLDRLLGLRDRIVAHYDRLIRDRGEGPVLYDLPR